mgnify:CR=1 FL=1
MLKTSKDVDKGTRLALLKGAVGDGPGGEFAAFVDTFDDLPSIDNLLLNPGKAPIPTNPGVLFVLTNTLAAQATKDNLASVVKYFDRLSDQGHPEYAVAAMKEMSGRDNSSLSKTRTFCECAARHNHILS